MFIALLLAALVGYTAVAYRLGGWAEARFGWRYTSPYVMAPHRRRPARVPPLHRPVIGLIGPLRPLAVAARALGFLGVYIASTVGFGAVLLDFLAAGGFRQWRRRREPVVPVVPPPPAAPSLPATELPPATEPPVPPADPWETR